LSTATISTTGNINAANVSINGNIAMVSNVARYAWVSGFPPVATQGNVGDIWYQWANQYSPINSMAFTRSTVTVSKSLLGVGTGATASANLIVPGFKGYALYSIATSANAWVTVYSSNIASVNDYARGINTDPTQNSGVIAEVITTTATPYYYTPAITGYTVDGTPAIPIRVTNLDPALQTMFVTLQLLQLES
jgi:hypothetical protein